jgi:hypothetical protein
VYADIGYIKVKVLGIIINILIKSYGTNIKNYAVDVLYAD